jgi:hypothetical protein
MGLLGSIWGEAVGSFGVLLSLKSGEKDSDRSQI